VGRSNSGGDRGKGTEKWARRNRTQKMPGGSTLATFEDKKGMLMPVNRRWY